ncbi:hypothetical protein MGG_15784 [Pyricularia oryzae 70-15]|uniref:Uncharacterized protein n=3 Tax=Pyricularia oryzae TaxID=318829 RepID=G4MWL9_PYRO7|nr:uncharacterized protein MGG_15784 [Pyricularia oryzae 70-15]EHA55074.1 hypothetical protein MGG_15784 [Pyricularia oryzae 70-15]ELQ36724.1 hypothetical protein OOU_Y34scaffold00641g8 [Pyricularia oryzae Y34]
MPQPVSLRTFPPSRPSRGKLQSSIGHYTFNKCMRVIAAVPQTTSRNKESFSYRGLVPRGLEEMAQKRPRNCLSSDLKSTHGQQSGSRAAGFDLVSESGFVWWGSGILLDGPFRGDARILSGLYGSENDKYTSRKSLAHVGFTLSGICFDPKLNFVIFGTFASERAHE